ncbi:helix-turn-helix domain-containing protein [Campylobacter hepaticus]|uniref:helix-turn-helix domain-containing protein n=1 Tax=Campylobacter hepaticus TaxID=1813019 RepID=UPI0018C91E95|nr:helix-turn-helix domain-containing protein [Campylobacter hepaticus]MCZ0772679.1 helix-turn-helix domain-containing protein [Campylobacter hepaticus]MCZ0774147.1 helix-turn-helix domain-containing protein [Campylobacter hepaticus]MCZ0775399.1 helix-turn-helix domain-containing protein [Campylobacter hepaticus]QPM43304.1 helix-turn-helix domain-containing protein [Campylobacter hepaticus]WAP49927.1 helix-turn-helix domain-containing protein [Campylobacter hepaticus]
MSNLNVAMVPAFIRYSKDLSPMEKLIWIELSVNMNEHGYCKASLNDFAKVFYVSKNTISRAINKLKKLDLIDIEENSGKKRKFLIKRFNKHNLTSEGFNSSKSHDEDLKSDILPKKFDEKLWKEWLMHHKCKTKKDYTKIALKRLATRMQKFFDEGVDVNDLIKKVIENNWTGFLFLKQENKTNEDLIKLIKNHGFYLSDVIKAPKRKLKVGNEFIEAFCENGKWKLRRLNE